MKYLILGIIFLSLLTSIVLIYENKLPSSKSPVIKKEKISQQKQPLNPLSIEAMRQRSYPGSNIVIEQTLEPGSNYNRYIVSYQSDGLKIYALLTVPQGTKPENGWPVIIFNHGYIPPEIYKTTERYLAYVDAFARNGYLVFKPDYRGNGQSEGKPEGAYYSPAYAIDDLNAISSIKKFKDADANNGKPAGIFRRRIAGR